MKIITLVFLLIISQAVSSQMQRDQDLVTLKNGYQILGYVIEQEPGKLIRVYRPDENDTVVANMTDISKLTKIWVQTFSGKTVESTDLKPDTLEFGRFNNKENIFSIHYSWQLRDIEAKARRGVGIAYYRSYKNKYWAGVSSTIFALQDPKVNFPDVNDRDTRYELSQIQFMFENKVRLSLRPQNKRVTTLLGLNIGYVADNSRISYKESAAALDVEYEKYAGGFMFQSNLAMRVNPDNNSGFMLETGYALLPQVVKQYSEVTHSPESVYLGFRRQINHLFTLKIAYFF